VRLRLGGGLPGGLLLASEDKVPAQSGMLTADRSGCGKTESLTNRKEAKVPPQSGGSKKELLTNLEVGGINS
jgi:hypothetical protein